MAEASCPRAYRYVFRLRGRFGSGHQGVRACGGLYRQYLAGHLADIHVLQVTSAGLCLEAGRGGAGGEKGHKASDSIGTLHVAHFVPFEHNHIGFFTVYDGDMEKYFQDFADKTSFTFRYSLSACRWRAANPGRKERPGVLSVGTGQQLSRRSGFTAPIQASRFKTSEPCWPIPASRRRPPLDSAVCRMVANHDRRPSSALAEECKLTRSAGDEGPGASSPDAWSKAA